MATGNLRRFRTGVMATAAVTLAACGPAASSPSPVGPEQLYLTLIHAAAPSAADEVGDEFLLGLGEELCDIDGDAAEIEQRAIEAVYAEMESFDAAQADLVQAVAAGVTTQLCPPPALGPSDGASSGSSNALPTGTLPPLGPMAESIRSTLVSSVRSALEGAAAGSGPIVGRITSVELTEGELAAEFTLATPYEGLADDIAFSFTSSTAGAPDFVALRNADPLIAALVWHAPNHRLRVIVHDGVRTFEAISDAEQLAALAAGTLTQEEWIRQTDAGYVP